MLLLLFLSIFLNGCVEKIRNSKQSKNQALSKISSAIIIDTLGTNTGNSSAKKIIIDSDNIIEFKRSSNENMVCTYPSGNCRTNAVEYSGGANLYGDIPGSAGSFIHYMRFKLYSNGYFSNNPNGHFAMGLRGQYLSPEIHKDKAGHDGKGIIFGSIGQGYAPNKNNPSCVTKMLQAESWYKSYQIQNNFSSANNIFPTSCSDTILEDYKWYTIELEVTSHHYIIYKVYNSDGNLIQKSFYNDLPNYKDPNLTGWFIGHVFENQNAEWSLRMEDFQVGHIPSIDILYPVKDFTPSIYLSNNDVKISTENSNNFSIVINKNLPSNIKLHNIANRSRVWGCANLRKTKTSSDNLDCRNWQNYREIKINGDADWIYQDGKLVLRGNYLNTIPNQFYTTYFRLNPQDEFSQVSISFELVGQ